MYGCMFSHGLLFDDSTLISSRDSILRYGMCNNGPLNKEFGIYGARFTIFMFKDQKQLRQLQVICDQ